MIFVISLLVASEALAAKFVVTGPGQTGSGQLFEVTVGLDARDAAVNAVSGAISFASSLVTLEAIKDGNSVVNFWLEKPHEKNGRVLFSGVIPGGFQGILNTQGDGYTPGKILGLVFRAVKPGKGTIDLKAGEIFLLYCSWSRSINLSNKFFY